MACDALVARMTAASPQLPQIPLRCIRARFAASMAPLVSCRMTAVLRVLMMCWLAAWLCPVALAAEVAISVIQGDGARSPLAGQVVSTRGVVSLLTDAGFFMQEAVIAQPGKRSAGIYVFTREAPALRPGDRVRVQGRVNEFAVGKGVQALANPRTELLEASWQVEGHGAPPEPLRLAFPPREGLEVYEGMLLHFAQPFTVVQNHFLGRYGQLMLAAGGRLEMPTNRHPAGSAAARALARENGARWLLLDDASSRQNPDPLPFLPADGVLRVGDGVDELVGVIDYGLAGADAAGLAGYRLLPAVAPRFRRDNPRPAQAPAVGGSLRVASVNLLNYFTTLDTPDSPGCAPRMKRQDCRGADSAAEFARQQAKLLAMLAGLEADVIGLMELENNGEQAVATLVAALNALPGVGPYASVGEPRGGSGNDAIRVAMIYRRDRLRPVGSAFSDQGPYSRAPLAQGFMDARGEKFAVVVNHFKSKAGCPADPQAEPADADQGDGRGCWNARRVRQAKAMRGFVARVQRELGDPDVLLIGDLNAYAQEDPLRTLIAGGLLQDQVARFAGGLPAYSYVFDGESGYLDHVLATPAMAAQITGARFWAINADEPPLFDYNLEFRQPACARCAPDLYTPTPYRASDHDPLLIGIRLGRHGR